MIFVNDHTFIRYGNKYFSTGSLNNSLFKRYLRWFQSIEVLANERLATECDDGTMDEKNEVSCVTLKTFRKTNNIFTILSNSKTVRQEVLKSDCIVARLPSIYGIIAAFYANKFGKPHLVEVVGCPWDSLWNHGWQGKIMAPFMWLATRRSVGKATHVVYVTNEFLQRRYPSKNKTIGCSDVALPKLDTKVIEKRLQKIECMDKNKPIVLGTVGAVGVRYKGHEYVIKAISLLNKQGYNFEYHLVGAGKSEYLKSLASKFGVSDRVVFRGQLSHDEVFGFLDCIDIYVQPSKTEGLPRALVEAMSRGCPAIGSNVGGIPELLDPSCVFSKANVKQLMQLLLKFNRLKMLKQAHVNFQTAGLFSKEKLDNVRDDFYRNFANEIWRDTSLS